MKGYHIKEKTVFSTPWFNIVEKQCDPYNEKPYYGLQTLDYVSILAITSQNEILFVRQYRCVIDEETLELPGGHIEKGQNSEQAAKNELFEETGYLAKKLELLGVLNPDVGRLTNKLWCYLAKDLKQVKDWMPEDGIKLVKYPADQVYSLVKNGQLNNAFNLAVFFLADHMKINISFS